MSKEVMYQQCQLERMVDGGDGKKYPNQMVSWIPVRFAVAGNYVELKNDKDEWENGWLVKTAGANDEPVAEHILVARSQDYKKTRIASDV